MIPGKQYTPELVLAIVWRRKWLIVIPVVLIVTGSFFYARSLRDVYLSSTLILVVPQKVPENYVKSTVTTDLAARLRSIDQEVRTRTRLESTIVELDLFPERRKTELMQDLVDQMNSFIGVTPVQGDVFRVSFVSENPVVAQKVAEKLGSFFIDASLKDRAVAAEGTSMFLESEAEQAKTKLLETEQKLTDYRRQHNGELSTQVDANLQGQANVALQIQAVRNKLDRDRERQIELQRSIPELTAAAEAALAVENAGASVSRPPASASAGQLAEAEEQLRQMLLEKKPDHPDVRSLKSRITKLQKQVDNEQGANTALGPVAPPSVTNPRQKALQDAQYDLTRIARSIEEASAQEKYLVGRMNEYQRRIESAPARDNELIELTRDYSTFQGQYNSLLTKQLESKMSENLERSQRGQQFRILDPARVPDRPVYPNRPQIMLTWLMVALAVGLGLAVGAEYLDRSLRSEDDVRLALALPVLATIPMLEPPAKSTLRRKLFAGTAVAVLTLAAGAAWFVLR